MTKRRPDQNTIDKMAEDFLSDHKDAIAEANRVLHFILIGDGALLGLGRLEDIPGILVSASLMLLFFAYGFLYLHSRFESANIRYESQYRWADHHHYVHRLTSDFDSKSSLSGWITVSLAFVSVATLLVGLADQFVDEALFQSLSAKVSVAILFVVFSGLVLMWCILFSTLRRSIEDYARPQEQTSA